MSDTRRFSVADFATNADRFDAYEELCDTLEAELSETKENLADEIERHAQLQSRCFDGGGSQSVFDRVAELQRDNDALQAALDAKITICGDDRVAALKAENAELRKQLEAREGWQIVPIEPTEWMLQSALDCQDFDPTDNDECEAYAKYKAMLKAAPKP